MSLLREKLRYTEFHLPLLIQKYPLRILYNSGNPYQEEFDITKSIFIHVPINAGTSISKTLYKTSVGHVPVSRYKIFNEFKFNSYTKFAVIRNPWDRLYSAFKYLKKTREDYWLDAKFAAKYLSDLDSFEDFVLELKKPRFITQIIGYKHFIPQYMWITLPGKRSVHQMNHIVRFENLNNEFNNVLDKLYGGIECELPHERKTVKKDYKEIYTDEMIEIVAELYSKDINMFNYTFK